MKRLSAIVLIAIISVITPVAATEPRAKLTSLEWPPYSSLQAREGGATVAVAHAAFKAAGWVLEVEFLPWKRAVEIARAGSGGVTGYFPEYFDSSNQDFEFSSALGVSPVGFAELQTSRFVWNTLTDLSAIAPIGVVDGYANSPEFDAAVLAGTIKVETVKEDALNLKKILRGRIRTAVIDRYVMNHLMKTDPELLVGTGRVGFNSRLLIEQKLFVAFRKSPEADAVRVALNRGLQLIKVEEILNLYLSQLQETSGDRLALDHNAFSRSAEPAK